MGKTIDRALKMSPAEFKPILDDELNRFAGLKHDSSESGGQVEGRGFLVRHEMCPSETGIDLQIDVQKNRCGCRGAC